MTENSAKLLSRTPYNTRLCEQEGLILEFIDLIYKLLKETKISKAELAKSLKMHRQRLNEILDGRVDVNIREMADIFTALNHKLGLRIKKKLDYTDD